MNLPGLAAVDINLTTPALLFPALSLLLLAYTNRFVVLAGLIRNLHERYKTSRQPVLIQQIGNLRYRVALIKHMQAAGIMSMLLCVVCMFLLFSGNQVIGKLTFAISLLLLITSLGLSLVEIWMSVGALNLLLSDLEDEERGETEVPGSK